MHVADFSGLCSSEAWGRKVFRCNAALRLIEDGKWVVFMQTVSLRMRGLEEQENKSERKGRKRKEMEFIIE